MSLIQGQPGLSVVVWAQKLYFVSERVWELFLREVSYKTRDWN